MAAARGRRNGGDVGRSRRDTWKEMSLGTWLEMCSQKEACHAGVGGDISKGTAAHGIPTLGQEKMRKTQGAVDKNK